ncbi:MAG: DNA polymerase IV [Bacteroidales bacterium]|nr:DNA polymerase IV [Bacteroidales bacterium]
MEQIIIHVDMDAFYASVEIRDNPELRGKPLIIGSLPHERGVVATCSYEARKYGVHSAMNIKEAYRLCPQGVFMHPNFDKYKEVSAQINDIWNTYASVSQRISLDEAYLDVTEQAVDWEGARRIGHLIKQRVLDEVGLTCSVGVAYSMTAAKMASEEKKPNGYFEIPTAEDFVNLILDRDVGVLYTVGAQTAKKLHDVGIQTVRDLRDRSDEVVAMLGKHGRWLVQVAHGEDSRPVVPYRPQDAKSIGRELTFQENVMNYIFLKDALLLLALSVENRASRYDLKGRGITLKLTYTNMQTISRSRALNYSTSSAVTIYNEAVALLDGVKWDPVRLIGVSIYNLSDGDVGQMVMRDMLEEETQQQAELQQLLDSMQQRYGLDFAGHLEQIFHWETMHKTIEYMRKHFRL